MAGLDETTPVPSGRPVSVTVEIDVDPDDGETVADLARRGWDSIRHLQAPIVTVTVGFNGDAETLDVDLEEEV